MGLFTPSDWYWAVYPMATQVYSSKRAQYVYINDSQYLDWLRAGNITTKIDSEDSLNAVLLNAYPQAMIHATKITPTMFFAKFDPTTLTNVTAAGVPATTDGKFISYFLTQSNSQETIDITSSQIDDVLSALVLLTLLTSGEKTTIVTPT